MSLLVCYDAYDEATIPPSAEYLMGYQHNLAAIHARWPHAKKVWSISTTGGSDQLDYDGCDAEAGDAWPAEAAADWAAEKIRAKLGRPWIYVQLANRHLVVDALAARELAFGAQVDCWMARWLPSPTPPAAIRTGLDDGYEWGVGNVAWQFFRAGQYTYDVSVVRSSWAFPAPPVPKEEKMLFIKEPNGAAYWFIAAGAESYWRPIPAKAAAMLPAGSVIADDGTWLALWKVGA